MTDFVRSAEATAPRVGAGWGWILGYGILSVLLGFSALVWPFTATLAATLVVGALFLVTGATSLAAGIAGRGHEGRGYSIFFGLVSVIAGLVLAFQPVTGAISLTLVVAVWLFARGVMELVLGFRLRRRRGWLLALGAINVVLGIVIVMTLPASALTLLGYILGISLIFGGANAISSALDHKKGASAFAL